MDIFFHGKLLFQFFKSGCKDNFFRAINQRSSAKCSQLFHFSGNNEQEWMTKIGHPLVNMVTKLQKIELN